MNLKLVISDEKGQTSPSLPVIQGESKTINAYFLDEAGVPFLLQGTLTELLVKVYTNISASSIQKKLSLSTVTPLYAWNGTSSLGLVGLQFQLAASDTKKMAPNNSGLSMSVQLTDSAGIITEVDGMNVFSASLPLILT